MKTKQTLAFLAVQPYFLTVGQPGGFKTAADFYKFAAQECGFEGVTLTVGDPFINLSSAMEVQSYRDDLQADLQQHGLKHGALRLEMHVIGQNICLDPSRVKRFGFFLTPDFRGRTHLELEALAKEKLQTVIDVSAKMGYRHIPGFCGGRGYAVAQAKWSAWPKHLPEWALGLLAFKWTPLLEYAVDRRQVITFEIGHPENDLLTGANFVTFWSMLTPKARKGVGVNADGSHFVNVGVNPLPHFKRVANDTKSEFTNHYKWGAVNDKFDGAASPYGGFQPWSEASTSFYTIGTVGDPGLIQEYHDFIAKQHSRQKGGVAIVYEGECVGIKNPKQAMKVGAHNCRVLRDGGTLIRLEGFLDDKHAIQLRKFQPESRPQLRDQQGKTKLDSWAGGPFDAFADSPVPAPELLSMNAKETQGVMKVLERSGFVEAVPIGKKHLKGI